MRKGLPEAGVYALVLQVTAKAMIAVGRLESLEFVPGVYIYVGSALNSLPGRIARHFRSAKRIRWHIDYLLGDPSVRLLSFAIRSTTHKIECAMSRAIQESAVASTNGFGSSDCNCDSHLHRFVTVRVARQALRKHEFQFRSREYLE
jgi:Uri superfamily endonuclease